MAQEKHTDHILATQIKKIGYAAKHAASIIANASTEQKNTALRASARILRERSDAILLENNKDMETGREKGLADALLDRLELNEQRIAAVAAGIEQIVELNDPVGETIDQWKRPNGLVIARKRVPLGVIGIIYESRPNVTADAGALCLKSGNAAILRGGSESFHSSTIIADCLHRGLEEAGLPSSCIQLIPTIDRQAVGYMLTLSDSIDVIIPRGGKGLCKRVQDESRIPTLQHLDGNCHTYIHHSADLSMAVNVVHNAKLRRTGICGATESLVIDASIADRFIPAIIDSLEGCSIVGDDRAMASDTRIGAATEDDWNTEYLAAKVSIKIVDSTQEAIDFVNMHSSHHTDAIIASDADETTLFLNQIDSAIVMHNTSTQFADGGEFGMGAEIGISTGKLHARGPVGVEQLTTYKYIVEGNGQIRP